jgi:hypothetical protein
MGAHAPTGQFANLPEYPNASFKGATAPNIAVIMSGIVLEPEHAVRRRLGRSPGDIDPIVVVNEGPREVTRPHAKQTPTGCR